MEEIRFFAFLKQMCWAFENPHSHTNGKSVMLGASSVAAKPSLVISYFFICDCYSFCLIKFALPDKRLDIDFMQPL